MIINQEITEIHLTFNMIFGIMFILAGGILNHEVVISNDGRMPVNSPTFVDTDRHFGHSNASGINYYQLSDKYPIKLDNGTLWLSLGDFLAFAGLFILLRNYYLILKLRISERRKELNMTEEQKTMETVDVDPAGLDEVDSVRKDLIDFEKYRLKNCKIESVDVVRVPTKYAKAKDGKVHRLKVIGEIVESVEIEKDGKKETIDFRPSCLIGMEEDLDGKLLGYPKREKSDYQRFLKALKIENIIDAKGKELPMSIHEANNGSKFLDFFYN